MNSRIFKEKADVVFSKRVPTTPLLVLEAPTLDLSPIEYLKQIPQNELYRLIVDGHLHKIESGWLGYANRELGSLDAAFKGLEFALSDLDLLVSPSYLKQIHHRCGTYQINNELQIVVGDKKVWPGQFRESLGGFYLFDYQAFHNRNNFLSEQGFYEFYDGFIQRYKQYGAMIVEVEENEPSNYPYYIRANLPVSEKTKEQLWQIILDKKELYYRAPDAQYLGSLLDICCDEFNREVLLATTQSKKLEIIVKFIKEIELIHAFSDFNGRTSLVLLQRLLIQNGFLPAMLFDPNYFDGHSTHQLIDHVINGMHNTMSVLQSPGVSLFGFSSCNVDLEIHRLLNINKTYTAMMYMAPEASGHPNYEGPSYYAMALHTSRQSRACLLSANTASPLLASKLSMMNIAYARIKDELYSIFNGTFKKIQLNANELQRFDNEIPLDEGGKTYVEQASAKIRVLTQRELVIIADIIKRDIEVSRSPAEKLYDFIQELENNPKCLPPIVTELRSPRPF